MNTIGSVSTAASELAARGVSYAPEIAVAAAKHGLDPELLAAIAAQETGGPGTNAGRNVVGDGGHGRGLFQIDDRWHGFARTGAAMDPAQNAEYAAGMLSGLLKRYGGDVHQALSAYNAGSPKATGTVTTWRDGKTLGYADSVMRHYADLGGASGIHDDLLAESQNEQSSVNSLQAFARQIPSYCPAQSQPYSYRQLAHLDDSGNASGSARTDFALMIDAGDAGDDS